MRIFTTCSRKSSPRYCLSLEARYPSSVRHQGRRTANATWKVVHARDHQKRMTRDTHLICEYDTFSENNVFNRILKSCVLLLLRYSDVSSERKAKLRKLMIYFEAVDEIPSSSIRWDMLRYDRNTRTYQMLHSLCYFLLQSRLLTTESGDVKMERFSDAHTNLLFQRFVMEYYKRKHP